MLATTGIASAASQRARDARTGRLLDDPPREIAQLVREGNAPRPWFAPLSARQAHLSELLAVGLTSTEIARRLRTSTRLVDAHVQYIFVKLGVNRRRQVAEWVWRSRPS